MSAALRWVGATFLRVFFPDARTPLQRRELLLTFLVILLIGAMWAGAAESGRLTENLPFDWN